MRKFSTARFLPGAVLLAILCGPQQASAQKGASCHAGMSFDRFLADLKQQAVAAGVSQRAIAEASPGLVYDQGIVNRDRGQRVFGQVFTEFAGRMAATYRMQQGQARIKTYAAAFARAEKEYAFRRLSSPRSGAWKATSAPIWATCRRCVRWSHWPMTAAARRCSRTKPSRP